MGIGRYVGEVRPGPDGQFYEWVEGVDGLGNPIGFWKAVKAVGGAIGKAAGAVGGAAGKAAGAVVDTVGKAAGTVGKAAGTVARTIIKPICPRVASYIPGFGGLGAGRFIGEIRQAPDGNLYQWEEGVDGLGNPVGFWKAIKALKAIKAMKARRPWIKAYGGRIPRVIGTLTAPPTPPPRYHPTSGTAGLGIGRYVGEIRQDANGNLYQWEEGVDGLGNPIGFWKAIKAVGGAIGKAAGAVVGTVGKAAGAVGSAVGKATGFVRQVTDPLWLTFKGIVKSNQVGAERQPVPPHYKRIVLDYARENPADGAILRAGLARNPRFWKGGWIMNLQPDAQAMTLDTDVFFNPGKFDIALYVHEMVHVAQYGTLGISGFSTSYFGIIRATIIHRWCHNKPINKMRSSPHERRAYALECRFLDWLVNKKPTLYKQRLLRPEDRSRLRDDLRYACTP
jgi:hypothetical protein